VQYPSGSGYVAGSGRGFTLVEVVVALTILSLIMLATVTGLRTLANTQSTLERVTARVDEVRTVSGFLRDTLESVVAEEGYGGHTQGTGGGGGETTFRLYPDAVELTSIVLIGEGLGGSYLLRVGREEDQLVLRWLEPRLYREPKDWNGASSRVLVNNLEELNFSYRRGLGAPWLQEWDWEGKPQLMRMQIKASGRFWPDLVFRL
jgi:general secretion pathway protein J